MNTKTNDVKTFEDAYAALGIETSLPDVSALPEQHQKAIIAHYKLVIIAEALNQGWKPDWSNTREPKYYPWFDLEGQDISGSGLSCSACVGGYTYTSVGSRLCFKSSELALYAGYLFEALYADYFLFTATIVKDNDHSNLVNHQSNAA